MTPDEEAVSRLFLPSYHRRLDELRRTNKRLVHYTTAEAAKAIIEKRRIWMRNAQTMNDFSDIRHGLRCVSNAYNDPNVGGRLKSLLDSLYGDIPAELEGRLREQEDEILAETYLTCVSEHDDSEDALGRLSMWRAYGPASGVAMVIRSAAFASTNEHLKAYSSPVAYLDDQALGVELLKVIQGLEANVGLLQRLSRDQMIAWVFHTLRWAALSTKHPGFREELEWRVVYAPTFEKSEVIERAVEVVRGTPQVVYKIPLENTPENKLLGASLEQLIDHIIIGPTAFPQVLRQTFIALLEGAGVQDAHLRVTVSEIPLRPFQAGG